MDWLLLIALYECTVTFPVFISILGRAAPLIRDPAPANYSQEAGMPGQTFIFGKPTYLPGPAKPPLLLDR